MVIFVTEPKRIHCKKYYNFHIKTIELFLCTRQSPLSRRKDVYIFVMSSEMWHDNLNFLNAFLLYSKVKKAFCSHG